MALENLVGFILLLFGVATIVELLRGEKLVNKAWYAILGAIVGVGGYFLYKLLKNQKPTSTGAALSLLGGTIVGLLQNIVAFNHMALF
jgi:chromate transport protein ChrA